MTRLPLSAKTLHRLALLVILAVSSVPGRAGDVSFFGMIKLQYLTQAPGSSPVSPASNAFSFQAIVVPDAAGSVTAASIKPGNTTPLRVLQADALTGWWRFEEVFNTAAARDAVYPTSAGSPVASPVNYAVTIETLHDGTASASLSFYLLAPFLQITTPNTPTLANLPEAQAIDTSADFTLHWTYTGGTALDVLQLLVLDSASNNVFASPAPFQAGALTDASTSILIPAGTLPSAANLTGHLLVARPGFTNSADGGVGFPALAKDVAFPLVTRPAPLSPRLSLLSVSPASTQLGFQGETNRNYHLQSTTNLQAWEELLVTNSPTGTGVVVGAGSGAWPRRFYRIRVGP